MENTWTPTANVCKVPKNNWGIQRNQDRFPNIQNSYQKTAQNEQFHSLFNTDPSDSLIRKKDNLGEEVFEDWHRIFWQGISGKKQNSAQTAWIPRVSESPARLSPRGLRIGWGGRDLFLMERKGGFCSTQKLILIPALIKEEKVLHTASARLPWHHQLLIVLPSIIVRIFPVPRGDQGGGREAAKGLF